ncbi:MAG: 4Fe-4S dicluster domain-containing protein [Paracoccaceae bacterium]|nr:4Fe-4S dicluster domain-containing protein [Paracoccaceae bacterium]MDG1371772.1 4Fe-4S dicluster domain-containing protein [Paracoccaceae bacterium]
MVYWAPDPSDIPHGDMQRWFYTRDPGDPHITKARAERTLTLDIEDGPLAPERADLSANDWTEGFEDLKSAGHFEMIGATTVKPEYLLEGASVSEGSIIILGVAHDYDEISKAPETRAGAEVLKQYGRAGAAAKVLSNWIRSKGWNARPVTGPMTGEVLMIPPALDCGFGELGKHGSIISAEYGSSFRLAAILTDAPVPLTEARDHGADGFCQNCRICEDACPPFAIAPEKQTVRGVEKWYVDFDLCIPFFNEHQGCAICIAVCPWSRPGAGLNLAAKLARKAAREA